MYTFQFLDYDDAIQYAKIINLNTVEYKWSVFIPHHLPLDLSLYELKQIVPASSPQEYPMSQVVRDGKRRWIDLYTSIIDRSPGLHIYRASFVNTKTDETCYKFLSYKIQDDSPERPYIYMNRNKEDENGSK